MAKTTDLSESIILLSDDDDDDSSTESNKRLIPSECLNVECKSSCSYMDAVPSFVLTYYRVRKRHGLKVCQNCFDEACSYYEDLKTRYMQGESIYKAPCSKYKPVLNIDSDEEDLSPDEEEVPFDGETIRMLSDNLGPVMRDIMNDPRTRSQIDDSYMRIKADTDKLREEYKSLEGAHMNIQNELDEIRRQIYSVFRPEIRTLPSIEIMDAPPQRQRAEPIIFKNVIQQRAIVPSAVKFRTDSSANLNDSSLDVVAVSEEVLEPPKTLPPLGLPTTKPKLKVGDVVYVMRHSPIYAWKPGVIVNVPKDRTVNDYVVRMSTTGKKASIMTQGKNLAYKTVCPFRFVVGNRIIAIFKTEANTQSFYSGIVAEPPKAMNRFRYLIFFDDGCAQYVPHENIRLICEPSSNPWEDTPADSREFTRKYLIDYPERPMVKLHTGNVVRVEYEASWWQAKVMEVDGSLANMLFLLEGRTEWIYRGSARLEPLFKEFDAAKRRKETGDRVRRIAGKMTNNSPYVEYTHHGDAEEADNESAESSSRPRSVARKSTASGNRMNTADKPAAKKPGPGVTEVQALEKALQPRKFVAHQCGPACVEWTQYDRNAVYRVTPLQVPLHFGFRRIICHFCSIKRSVMYRAPCGRSLRNMEEVHMYLRITKSEMTVDLFDYDYWVSCLAEFRVLKSYVYDKDITKGKELCAISCVNSIDHVLPQFSSYLTEREPRDDVGLNLDPNFLCGCDCTDDCQDREKCSCWQLTIESQKLIPNNVIDPNVGYHYRRLPERVITGIYECNPQCKCSKTTCLNRVVQYPLSQKLQLFKTEKKGWGLRCLNDIPQGAFICVYAGHLLTEHEANEEGKTYGDEYLAELDYIEVIESTKEGYESDVPEEDLNEDDEQQPDDMGGRYEEDSSASSPEPPAAEPPADDGQQNVYKSRLRERKTKKVTAPQPSTSQDSRPKEPPKPKKKKEEMFSIRKYYGDNEGEVFIMDAKCSGNIGRYLNHSCMPNVFVQNVFVDTHDLRFPWVAFFAQTYIIAGTELTWDYNYDIGSVEGKIKYCYCGSIKCRGRLL